MQDTAARIQMLRFLDRHYGETKRKHRIRYDDALGVARVDFKTYNGSCLAFFRDGEPATFYNTSRRRISKEAFLEITFAANP